MGSRNVFRVVQLIFSFAMFLLQIIPHQMCPRIQRASFIKVARECLSHEFRAVYCPSFKFNLATTPISFKRVVDEKCQGVAGELVWNAITTFLLFTVFFVDFQWGHRYMVRNKKWPQAVMTKVYWIMLTVTSTLLISIIVSTSLTLGVRWPDVVGSIEVETEEQYQVLKAKEPPLNWVVILNVSIWILCGNAIEAAYLIYFPDSYFQSADDEELEKKEDRSRCEGGICPVKKNPVKKKTGA